MSNNIVCFSPSLFKKLSLSSSHKGSNSTVKSPILSVSTILLSTCVGTYDIFIFLICFLCNSSTAHFTGTLSNTDSQSCAFFVCFHVGPFLISCKMYKM